jgi:PPM family protein phosphatase
MSAPARWNCGVASDTGLLREHNEDRYWVDPARGIFLVVDGLGGQAAGELAAQTAVDVIRESLLAGDGPAQERVRAAITAANNRICELAAGDERLQGMGCVLTLALAREGRLTYGHVGDTRLYLVENAAFGKLTHDHSPVGESEDAGELSEAESMRHPRRHEVYRDVGSRPRAADDPEFIETGVCSFERHAAILLASDGLTDRLTAVEIRRIVERYRGDAGEVARELVDAANRAGGQDNVTVLFVAGAEFRGCAAGQEAASSGASMQPPRASSRSGVAKLLKGRLAYLTYGLLLGMILWAVLRASKG